MTEDPSIYQPDPDLHIHLCIASGGSPEPEFCMSAINVVAFYATHRMRGFNSQNISFNLVSNCIVNQAREELAASAVERKATHVLFMDDDMVVPGNAACLLAMAKKPIVGVNYRMRKRDREFVSCGIDGCTRVATTPDSKGLEEVSFTGFGFCLIERQVFEALEKPWFPIWWNEEKNHYIGEDAMFMVRAREAGFATYIDHDLSKQVAHIGRYRYRWDSNP